MGETNLSLGPVIIVEDTCSDYEEIYTALTTAGFHIYTQKKQIQGELLQTFQEVKDAINMDKVASFTLNCIEDCVQSFGGLSGIVCDYELENGWDIQYWTAIVEKIRSHISSNPNTKNIFQEVPIVGCSSGRDADIGDKFLKAGADMFLSKDKIANHLWKSLKELIEKKWIHGT